MGKPTLENRIHAAQIQEKLGAVTEAMTSYSRMIFALDSHHVEIETEFLDDIASRLVDFREKMQQAINAGKPGERWIAIPYEEWRELLKASGVNIEAEAI